VAIDREKVTQAALKFAEKKRYDKAIVEYQRIIQEDPNDARTLLKIGDLQLKMDAFPAAIDTYERVGKHYAAQGFSLKAIAVYKQIRDIIAKHVPQLEDRYGHILPKLAELYQQLGLVSDALAAYDEVASRLLKAGKDKEAITVFKKIVELDPTNPLPHLRLAEALARSKDVDGALEQFTAASDILLKLGRRDDALKVVDRIFQIRPDPDYAKRAALMFLERKQPNDGLNALAKLQVAFQANPKDLETLGLLARAFELIGQRPKAIEVQKEQARLAKEQGRDDMFRTVLDHLLRVAPDDEQVRALHRGPQKSIIPTAGPASQISQVGAPSVSVSAAELSVQDLESLEDLDLPVSEQPFELSRPSARVGDDQIVDVPDSVQAVEDVGAHSVGVHAETYVQQSLADSLAFRQARLYPKAIEQLRIALEVVPGSVELRESLRDVLLDIGDESGAVGEMITIAAIELDRGEYDRAAHFLQEVLMLVPDHHRAREMLASIGYGGLEPVAPDQTEGGASGLDQQAYNEDFAYASVEVPQYEGYDPERPLPSYDLEEMGGVDMLNATAERRAARGPELETDDPFDLDGPGDARGELPTFQLEEEDLLAAAAMSHPDAPLPAEGVSVLGGKTRAFQGGDSIEDALEEVEFFSSRGLWDDARAIVNEQLLRAPNHPLLMEKLRELDDAAAASADGSVARPVVREERTQVTAVEEIDIGGALDALDDAFEPMQEAQAHFKKDDEQVDVEEVFAKFKEGVKAQVDDNDSATHYDLGVAYKEMGLIGDSISEFTIAARDPKRECVCLSMVGVIELERGHLDKAAEAFKRALNARTRTLEQELSLYYELGSIYEAQQINDEALYYFRKIQRKDPSFRDVGDRVRALEGGASNASGTRQLVNEDDFDSAFDDIVGTKSH
jgi:tetratricopeptide (TPR) repeat protein